MAKLSHVVENCEVSETFPHLHGNKLDTILWNVIEDKGLYYSWYNEEQEPYACFGSLSLKFRGFPGDSVVSQPAVQETRGWS